MLEAGLDVWTTVNVQHLESLNDVVAGITGIRQQETMPDHIFDDADEIELIDLPPDDLLERLRAGKVYVPEQAGTALERFFRKPNLIALRELALRRTADRVDAAAREYAGREPVSRPWLARDRFLVAVAPDDQAEELVRFGKRFADALDAEWTVVSVETPADAATRRGRARSAHRGAATGRVARRGDRDAGRTDGRLGAPRVRAHCATRPGSWSASRSDAGCGRSGGARRVDDLLRHARGIDVSVIAQRDETARRPAAPTRPRPRSRRRCTGTATAGPWRSPRPCTGLALLMDPFFSGTNLVMVYLLGRGDRRIAPRAGPGGADRRAEHRLRSTSSSCRRDSRSPSRTCSTW